MRCFITLLCLCFYVSNGTASNDRTFFWKIEPSKQQQNPQGTVAATVFLLGSVHVADASFYPLRKLIEKNYQTSDFLVVEVDASKIDAYAYRRLLAERGEYKGNETISDHLSVETLSDLQRQLQALGVPMSSVEKYKPGTLVMTISMLQMMKMGYSPELGIDLHFLKNASDKKIVELESIEEQINLLLDITDIDLLLQETLNSMAKTEVMIEQLMALWKSGDERAMEALLFTETLEEYPSFSLIYEKLFFDRNLKMADKIKRFLKTDANYFVIVGAGHLIGDRGIINLLRQQGYLINRL